MSTRVTSPLFRDWKNGCWEIRWNFLKKSSISPSRRSIEPSAIHSFYRFLQPMNKVICQIMILIVLSLPFWRVHYWIRRHLVRNNISRSYHNLLDRIIIEGIFYGEIGSVIYCSFWFDVCVFIFTSDLNCWFKWLI